MTSKKQLSLDCITLYCEKFLIAIVYYCTQGEVPVQWFSGPQHKDVGHGDTGSGGHHACSREPSLHTHHQWRQALLRLPEEHQGLGHPDTQDGEGLAHSEPLGQGTRHLRQVPLLRLLPSRQGMYVYYNLLVQ